MIGSLRIGTRRSALALAQAAGVGEALRRAHRSIDVELVPMTTSGDRSTAGTQRRDFTDQIDEALLGGTIDLAVHSAKDLESQDPPGILVGAYPRREDARDAVVLQSVREFRRLPSGARIGSSSARRRAQLLRHRPDLDVVELRGNVDTRLARVAEGTLDGVVVAWAGLRRLGRTKEAQEVLSTRWMLPAPGQGALAVAVRSRDRRVRRIVSVLDDPGTRSTVTAERAFVRAMGGDCTVPLAALAGRRGSRLRLRAAVYSPDGQERLAVDRWGLVKDPRALASAAARRLLDQNARALWTER